MPRGVSLQAFQKTLHSSAAVFISASLINFRIDMIAHEIYRNTGIDRKTTRKIAQRWWSDWQIPAIRNP